MPRGRAHFWGSQAGYDCLLGHLEEFQHLQSLQPTDIEGRVRKSLQLRLFFVKVTNEFHLVNQTSEENRNNYTQVMYELSSYCNAKAFAENQKS